MMRIGVVGAGLSGLVLARRLSRVADVAVFEKSRGPGGRVATRYAGSFEFDHGAQFFTARTAAFRELLQPLLADGIIANWPAEFVELDRDRVTASRQWHDDYPHYVGVPRMNSIGKYLAAGLDISYETTVDRLARKGRSWALFDSANNDLGRFDWLVLTMPAPQTRQLVSELDDVVALCDEREMRACVAMMLGFTEPLDLRWHAALVRNTDISWVSVNSSKPGRGDAFTLVVHSTNAWADSRIDDDIDDIREHMLNEASLVTGEDLRTAAHCEMHRWRYANTDRQSGPPSYIDDDRQLALCGDWLVRGRIEAAFTSAEDLARKFKERIGRDSRR